MGWVWRPVSLQHLSKELHRLARLLGLLTRTDGLAVCDGIKRYTTGLGPRRTARPCLNQLVQSARIDNCRVGDHTRPEPLQYIAKEPQGHLRHPALSTCLTTAM